MHQHCPSKSCPFQLSFMKKKITSIDYKSTDPMVMVGPKTLKSDN